MLSTVANGGNISLYPSAAKLDDGWLPIGSVLRWHGNEEPQGITVRFPNKLYRSEGEALNAAKACLADYVQSGRCPVCY